MNVPLWPSLAPPSTDAYHLYDQFVLETIITLLLPSARSRQRVASFWVVMSLSQV